MRNFSTIIFEYNEGIATVWLNNPLKKNAFDRKMVEEITEAILWVNNLPDDTIMLLKARGDAFCSGADLNWMNSAFELNKDENYNECLLISRMLYELHNCKKVTIAVINGAAFGGGLGLATACDLALCSESSKFSLSELRIGIVAAVISPYLFKKLGESRMKELIYTARVFEGNEAEKLGLVIRSVSELELDAHVDDLVKQIQKGAPKARIFSKELIHKVAEGTINTDDYEVTAGILANVRTTEEARSRIHAFLNK